jgi:hypothetical protein
VQLFTGSQQDHNSIQFPSIPERSPKLLLTNEFAGKSSDLEKIRRQEGQGSHIQHLTLKHYKLPLQTLSLKKKVSKIVKLRINYIIIDSLTLRFQKQKT